MVDDTITMTTNELEGIKASVRVQAVLDIVNADLAEHKDRDLKTFDALFGELRKLDNDINRFPQEIAQCQENLRKEVEEKYMTKRDARMTITTIVSAAMVVQFFAYAIYLSLQISRLTGGQ